MDYSPKPYLELRKDYYQDYSQWDTRDCFYDGENEDPDAPDNTRYAEDERVNMDNI